MKLIDTQSPDVDLLILAGWGDWAYRDIPPDVIAAAAAGTLPRRPNSPAPEIPDPFPQMRAEVLKRARAARGQKKTKLAERAAEMRARSGARKQRAQAEGARRRWDSMTPDERRAATAYARSRVGSA